MQQKKDAEVDCCGCLTATGMIPSVFLGGEGINLSVYDIVSENSTLSIG